MEYYASKIHQVDQRIGVIISTICHIHELCFSVCNFWSRVSIFEAMEANSYHSFVAYKVFVFVWSVRSNITFMLPILSLLSNYFLTPIIFRNRVVQINIWFGNIVLCFSKSIIKIYRIITKTSVCRSGLWGPLAYSLLGVGFPYQSIG